MATLLLLLKGPMQSWGTQSRYSVRATDAHPSKSGVLGLVAAAQGRRRSDPLEDLAGLRFAVRVDQPGTVARDFQTAIDWTTGDAHPLISRYYLHDAIFAAGIEGARPLLEGIAESLIRSKYPLYLGRRSCPANPDLVIGVRDEPLDMAIDAEPWHASQRHRRQRPSRVSLPVFADALPGESGWQVQDVPVGFAQEHRQYSWRTVVQRYTPEFDNTDGAELQDEFFEAVISA